MMALDMYISALSPFAKTFVTVYQCNVATEIGEKEKGVVKGPWRQNLQCDKVKVNGSISRSGEGGMTVIWHVPLTLSVTNISCSDFHL